MNAEVVVTGTWWCLLSEVDESQSGLQEIEATGNMPALPMLSISITYSEGKR